MGMRRSPLSRLAKLTAGALVAFALCFVYIQVVMQQALIPPLAIFVVVSLVVAGVVARGWRWGPLLASVWFALVFLSSIPIIIADLSNPAAFHQFIVQLVTTGVAVGGFVAGIAATVQNYRAADESTVRTG